MAWGAYLLRRLLTSAGVLAGVVLLTYGLSRFSDADPVLAYLAQTGELEGARRVGPDDRAYRAAAKKLGADLPAFFVTLTPRRASGAGSAPVPSADPAFTVLPAVRWHGYPNGFTHSAGRLVRGDLGYSTRSGERVAAMLARALRVTLPIGLLALLLAVLGAVALGVPLARTDAGWLRALLYVVVSAPGFWLATLLVTQLAGRGRPFPGPGWREASASLGSWLAHAALPLAILAVPAAAYLALLLAEAMRGGDRAAIRDVARLHGLSERAVWWREMLPLGAVPTLSTAVGLLIPSFIGGFVVVEYVFNVPGLGRLVFESILARDWPVVLGVVLLSGAATVLGYTVMDVVNAWVDPRFRKFVGHGA